MELDPQEYDIVKLLTKLKSSSDTYPPELLTPRRQNYLHRVTEIGLGFGIAEGLKTTVSSGSKVGTSSSITAGGLIEAALVVAIVAEAGITAYMYRDRIAEIFQSTTSEPQVVEVTSVPETEFVPRLPVVVIEETDEVSATPPAVETPSGTPVPGAAASNSQEDEGSQSLSTPDPGGNSGNHYGQTPAGPDRPKDDGGNDDDKGKGKGK